MDFNIFQVKADSLFSELEKWETFYKKEIFILPLEKNLRYYKNFCPGLYDKIQIVRLSDSCKFYQTSNNDFLYKIYFIRGKEKILKLKNNDKNRVYLDISDNIDSKIDFFYAHFIYGFVTLC